MISLIENFLHFLDVSVGISLSYLIIVFLIRLVLTWYPKIDLNNGLWFLISLPSNAILNLTRKLIPPIGGVDVGPVIWVGVISFIREILVGQQGLIKIALHTNIS